MSQAATDHVLLERRGDVLWIIINREERRNALNQEVVQTIDRGIAEAVSGGEVKAIVLTGAGDKAFCAGADLAKNAKGFAFAVDFSRPKHYIVDLFKRLQECTLPVIARVNGHAMAGGFGLLCACDMVIAADDIRIGTTESKIGMTPMMIPTVVTDALLNCRITKDARIHSVPTTIHAHHQLPISAATTRVSALSVLLYRSRDAFMLAPQPLSIS